MGAKKKRKNKVAYSNGGAVLADATGPKTLAEGGEHLHESERKDRTHGVVPAATEERHLAKEEDRRSRIEQTRKSKTRTHGV